MLTGLILNARARGRAPPENSVARRTRANSCSKAALFIWFLSALRAGAGKWLDRTGGQKVARL
jgi:hypothetical protein